MVDRRRLVSAVLMASGVVIAVVSFATLVLMKLSLPPYSVQTEGKYVAYGLAVWLYGLWMIPIGSILTVLGLLIYPFSLFRKEILVIELAFALGALAILIRSASIIIGSWIESYYLPTLLEIFGGFVGMFLPLTATLLISMFTARRMWRIKPRHYEA
jgi:hypothetical protein